MAFRLRRSFLYSYAVNENSRKAAVKEVERVIDQLEKKVRANAVEQQRKKEQPVAQNAATAATDVAQEQPPAPTVEQTPADQTGTESGSPVEEVQQKAPEPQTPTPPKREKSPEKKRQPSPSKDKRSPSPKKDSSQRDKSPTKKDLSKRDKSPQKKTSPESGGVSVTVNGVLLPNTQTEPVSPEPVTSTASIKFS